MRTVAIVLTILAVVGFILGIICAFSGPIAGLGARVYATGSGVCLLLSINLLLLEKSQ